MNGLSVGSFSLLINHALSFTHHSFNLDIIDLSADLIYKLVNSQVLRINGTTSLVTLASLKRELAGVRYRYKCENLSQNTSHISNEGVECLIHSSNGAIITLRATL